MSDYQLPEWLKLELAANHRGIEIRWVDYDRVRKCFVLPMEGDAFHRLPVPRLGGQILYRRHLTSMSELKWRLHPMTYIPDPAEVSSGRWVVFQINVVDGLPYKLFDVVADDGTPLPLDRRVLDAILVRDGRYGAHEKAIADVERAPEDADALAAGILEESGLTELYEMIHHDVTKHCPGGANLPPDEDEPLVGNVFP